MTHIESIKISNSTMILSWHEWQRHMQQACSCARSQKFRFSCETSTEINNPTACYIPHTDYSKYHTITHIQTYRIEQACTCARCHNSFELHV